MSWWRTDEKNASLYVKCKPLCASIYRVKLFYAARCTPTKYKMCQNRQYWSNGEVALIAGFLGALDNSLASMKCLAFDTVVAKSSLAACRRKYFWSSGSAVPSTNFLRNSESVSGDLRSVFGQASRCRMRKFCSKTGKWRARSVELFHPLQSQIRRKYSLYALYEVAPVYGRTGSGCLIITVGAATTPKSVGPNFLSQLPAKTKCLLLT